MPPDREEIGSRLKRLAQALTDQGLEAALIRYPLNIFYFTGTFADGHLLVTQSGEAFLLVYRTFERARAEALIEEVRPFRSLKALPDFLKDLGIKHLALEEDRLPVAVYRGYERLLRDFALSDLSPILRQLRARKSAYEISCLRRAAEMLAESIEAVLPSFRPGLTELEMAGMLEAELRKRGHPAYTRTYAFHQELAYGHLLTGEAAAVPSYVTTGQGGRGVVGFPQGPSEKILREGEPLLIDYAGWHEGYLVDQSRLFYFGELPAALHDTFARIKQLMESLEETLRPGITAEEVYHRARETAEKLGLSPCFMAHGEERVPFVGHGVGLEIDEWPPLAPRVKVPLEEGMVVALEPKCHLPGQGVIGLEDTFLITREGAARLTLSPREIRRLEP